MFASIGEIALAVLVALGAIGQSQQSLPKPGEIAQTSVRRAFGDEKFSPDLQSLMTVQKRLADVQVPFSAKRMAPFGVFGSDEDPILSVLVLASAGFDKSALSAIGGANIEDMGIGYLVTARLSQLNVLARISGVTSVRPMKSRNVPGHRPNRPPTTKLPLTNPRARGPISEGETGINWDRKGLTGKGTIVAILDTGIDWKHEEFLNADGTSRILFLYDMGDPTWSKTNGKTGLKPPVFDSDGSPMGTLYTRAQLNNALKGTGTVNSRDLVGHGTACASVAAGKNQTLGGGLATSADLIIVKVNVPTASGGERISSRYPLAAKWVADEAKRLDRPVVMNMSFGSQHSLHDGKDAEETFLDSLIADNPGIAMCVAAGNEGREAFHARGRFGPLRPGQEDVNGEPIEMFVTDTQEDGIVNVIVRKEDDWGVMFVPRSPIFVDPEGEDVQAYFYVFRKEGKYFHGARITGSSGATPKWLIDQIDQMYTIGESSQDEVLEMSLPYGSYDVWGFGATEKVTDGSFSLYAPYTYDVTFGKGGSSDYMVGSPGNAERVITVGSYVFRNKWENADGGTTRFNLPLGSISSYSSPGPRRDGLIKPDIVAPGQYMLSALSAGSEMGVDSDGSPRVLFLAPGGTRLAWNGTSASTPFVAGVIALMFEKNPKLTSAQIKEILVSTATEDGLTGGIPNPYWGRGKLNPPAALDAVTAGHCVNLLLGGTKQ
jgi:subtilisin family serine protease